MKIILLISTLFTLTAFTVTDKKTLDEIPDKSYHPIVLGQKLTYRADLSTYSMTFDSLPTVINGLTYIKCTTAYETGQSISYYRQDGNRVLYTKSGQITETVEIPENPEVGLVWFESDSTWKYTVIAAKETLETPEANYINCLVIQSENINPNANPGHYQLYLQYFQRSRGYIGTKLGGLLYSYVTIEN